MRSLARLLLHPNLISCKIIDIINIVIIIIGIIFLTVMIDFYYYMNIKNIITTRMCSMRFCVVAGPSLGTYGSSFAGSNGTSRNGYACANGYANGNGYSCAYG